jgi:Spy/CpxP family protein refolding chaperone
MKNLINLKTATLLVLLAICSIPNFAQSPGNGQGRRRQMTEEEVKEGVQRTADSLDLTDAQEKKVLEFEMEYYKEGQKMFENFDPETGDHEAMRAKMMKQRDERNEKYTEVFTGEQPEKFKQMQERRRQQMHQRREEQSEGDRGRGRG